MLEALRGRSLAVLYVAAGFAVVVALVIGTGGDLGTALQGWATGAFGTGYSLTQTLADATPLALVAVGASVALRAGVVTVGAEGQAVLGAACATGAALAVGDSLPLVGGLLVGALAGVLGGVVWAVPAALVKSRWGVNEILFTLLSNYLATALLAYLLRTVLRDSASSGNPQSPRLPGSWLLPLLPVEGRLHAGVLLVVALLGVTWWWNRTRSAFVLEVHGQRPLLAARLGTTSARAALVAMTVSGAAAGLAGWMQVAGVTGRLQTDVAGGIGFAGLAVAVLGRGRALGIAVAAVVYAALGTGADGIQIATGTTPAAIGTVTQGVLLLAAALALAATVVQGRRRDRKAVAP